MKKLLLSLAAIAGFAFAGNAAEVVTQKFDKGIGLPEGAANAPTTEATEYTATDTEIAYEMFGAYVNTGYLMVPGKATAGSYISFSLGFDCETISLTTTSGCSTNAKNTVNIYADDNLIQENYQVNTQSHTYNVTIPADYQSAGTVYKVESATTSYNAQFASFTYYEVGAEMPEEPEKPTAPEGTISVAEALQLITDGYTGSATVKGYIISISEVSTSYGNATYAISDDTTGTNSLGVYRGYYLNGEKFTAEDQLAIGALVVVEGDLVNYNGNTPQFTTGSKIVEYNGETAVPEQPEQPEEPGDTDTLNNAKIIKNEKLSTYSEFTYTGASGAEYFLLCAGSNNSIQLRSATDKNYSGVVTTKSAGTVKSVTVSFVSNTVTGRTLNVYASNQAYTNAADLYVEGLEPVTTFVYDPEEDTYTYTFADDYEYVGFRSNDGALYLAEINVVWNLSSSVESIVADENAPVEYFNLQGVRVAEPAQGLYIRRQGDKVEKVVIR